MTQLKNPVAINVEKTQSMYVERRLQNGRHKIYIKAKNMQNMYC